ncbi:hypothetical protein DPMN_008103 [Dreissena polymorpha]|uniref:Uncharacterized protein n=1 Tax=Dreissena polymorpha TaxID=45954 RepID=A0A9D4RZB1_DREPO|nr:hypothetical protein DPMN_008103 [Dreissena polymorpha]
MLRRVVGYRATLSSKATGSESGVMEGPPLTNVVHQHGGDAPGLHSPTQLRYRPFQLFAFTSVRVVSLSRM